MHERDVTHRVRARKDGDYDDAGLRGLRRTEGYSGDPEGMHRQDMPGKTRQSVQVVPRVLRETRKGRKTRRNGGVCVWSVY